MSRPDRLQIAWNGNAAAIGQGRKLQRMAPIVQEPFAVKRLERRALLALQRKPIHRLSRVTLEARSDLCVRVESEQEFGNAIGAHALFCTPTSAPPGRPSDTRRVSGHRRQRAN